MLHKVEDKRRLYKRIQEHLKSSPELRPFPDAVTRLVVACRDPETNSKHIEEIVACDPSLSVKILRLANSPLFCLSRNVTSIVHAVRLLGRRKVKSIGMSAAALNMFASGDGATLQRQRLYHHCVGCGSVASCVANHLQGVESSDAFLAGVFHDVGKLLFYDVISEEYKELSDTYRGDSLVEEESFLFGTNHQEIGLTSANLWGLPNEILAAIGWHHRPEDAPFEKPYARVIAVANGLAKQWGIGSESDPLVELNHELIEQLGLTDSQLAEIEEEANEAFGHMNED